jgi:DNA-binding CsgD family transcriptional regulator/PAS domain-containing protein
MTIEAFESILDAIYGAAEDPGQWETVLASLTTELSGTGAALHAGAIDATGFSFGAAHRVDPEALESYAQHYYTVNPLNRALSRIPVGAAVADHHLIDRRELERTEFYNDFGGRFDITGSVTIMLERTSHHEACLGVTRSFRSETFSENQVAFVQRLAPHAMRALALNRRLAAAQNERSTFEAALDRIDAGILLLDWRGAIHYCNAAGQQLLGKRDGLTVIRGHLSASGPSVQACLTELVRSAVMAKGARGGSVRLPRRPPARPLVARIMPFGQRCDFWLPGDGVHAIVFISDPDAPAGDATDGVMEAYGLTPGEKKLVRELLAGRSLQEAADNLAIMRVTSRNRLAQIMAKTDVQRQAQLLQLILRSTIPVR